MRQIYKLTITAAVMLAAGLGIGVALVPDADPTVEEAFAIVLAELDEAGATIEDAGAAVDAAIGAP